MHRSWRVRAKSDEFELHIGSVDVGSSAATDSLEALEQLLEYSRLRHVRALLSEVHDSLREAVPGERAGDRPIDELLTERALQSATRAGRLLVRLRPPDPPSTFEPPKPPTAPRPKPKKPTSFVLTVLDEVGRAVPGIKISFDVGGTTLVVPTDGSGVARLDDVEGVTTAGASLVSIAQARDVLAPRWKDPRTPNIPTGNNIFVRALRSATDSITIPGATPATLVLTPALECREIPGAHFQFARSFVLSSALELLAGIAEELQGDDSLKGMIFGHTDRAGTEALNKELSERRAKALYALFTHDSDAWEELFSGKADGPNWKEKWDVEEVQHMLNALGVTDDDGNSLDEDGVRGPSTIQAIHRFQSGDYPDCPAEQAPLAQSNYLGPDGRKELFLAYAKRVTREPLDKGCFLPIGAAPFMGCGEYNPLSLTVKDAESRRAVVFVLDPAAAPVNPPCKLGKIKPCLGVCSPLPKAPNPDGTPPYRCSVYKAMAAKCPCQGGVELAHDLIVRLLITEEQADKLPHVFVLESDDGTISVKQTLSSDARATDDQLAELHFEHVPELHSYKLRAESVDHPDDLFDFTPFKDLHLLSNPLVPPQVGALIAALQSQQAGESGDADDSDSSDSDDSDSKDDSTAPAGSP